MSFGSSTILTNVTLMWHNLPADVMLVAQAAKDGPVGPEFGKSSPIGMLILVCLAIAVITAGWLFHRRYSRFRRRTMFAKENGLDPFDQEAVDAAMKEAGIYDYSRKSKF